MQIIHKRASQWLIEVACFNAGCCVEPVNAVGVCSVITGAEMIGEERLTVVTLRAVSVQPCV